MKKTNITTLSFVLILLLSAGCKKYLDKVPLDTINSSNFFKDSTDAINAINAAYQPLQRPKLYNLRMWTSDIFAGNSVVGAGGGTDGIETVQEANFTTDPSNQGVLDLYRGPYPGILYCNEVIQNVPGIKMDTTLRNRIVGEAKFLRANYYFILVRYFGDVPLITVPQTPEDDLYPARTPKDKVYAQIIQDLKDAIMHGAVKRIRPKLMTVGVILAGLIPIMFSHGAGSDVMKRIAAPMIGGVITSEILELTIYPAIYLIWKGRKFRQKNEAT